MTKHWALLVTAALLVVSTAGCTSEQARPEPPPSDGEVNPETGLVAGSGLATFGAGSARVAYRSSLSGGAEAGTGLTGEGLANLAAEQGSFTLDLAGPTDDGAGVGIDASVESIYDAALVYLRSPLITSLFGVATPWLRLDPATLSDQGPTADLAQITNLTGPNANAVLALPAGVVEGSVRSLGEQPVRGTPTTYYVATVNIEAAGAEADAVAHPQQWELFAAQLAVEELSVDLYLDAEGRLLRLDYEQPLPEESGGGTQMVEFELFELGADGAIAIPPPGEVTDFAEVLGGGG